MKIILTAIFSLFLVGCASTTVKDLRMPDGKNAKNVKCNLDSQKCFQAATLSCMGTNGEYNVITSHSNAGGTAADMFPSPVTCFNITYVCGKSDGKMPGFEFRGERYRAPKIQPSTRTTCSTYNGITNCRSR